MYRGSIRLAWRKLLPETEEANKIPSTRFYVIADEKCKHDIAIGEGYEDPDPDREEEEAPGLDEEDESPPCGQRDGTNSSVEADLPLQALMSSPGTTLSQAASPTS